MSGAQGASPPATALSRLREEWLEAIAEELPAAAELRHRLHAEPRVSGDEEDTARAVVAALGAGQGTAIAGTGRAVAIGAAPGDPIAIRSELDALPLTERTGVPWASTSSAMHACGHDVHLAALAALCRAATRVSLPVPILALLQPREEASPSGALDIVESGLLSRRRVRAVIGAHLQPRLAPGVVSSVAGPINASADEFEIVVTGQGGHSGYPHTLRDPILALSHIVVSLQQFVGRRIDPVAGVVCSIGRIHAGAAANVVPATATAVGSIRLMREADRPTAHRTLVDAVRATAQAHGCRAEVRVLPGEPALVNDRELASRAQAWLAYGGIPVDSEFRSFGADDFSYYGRATRSLMMFVGTRGEGPEHASGVTGNGLRQPGLHEERFLPPDGVIEQVAHALVAGYLSVLGEPSGARANDGGAPAPARPS